MGAFDGNPKKLGFGLMRLPRGADGEIDLDRVIPMVDCFLSAGFTYFDTAYRYQGSEEIARKAIVERYPRDSFTIADKLPLGDAGGDPENLVKLAKESLRRLGTDYFDYYLLHGLHDAALADELNAWEFMKSLKAKGVARHIGFSYHGKADDLDEILTRHPEVEFVQLQLNFLDWDSEDVQSRKNYEVATAHGVPVVVMEPVKGGSLMNVPAECTEKLTEMGGSVASYAIRFAASPENVKIVLSGMSDMAQMEENVGSMREFSPLSEVEEKAVFETVSQLRALPSIACTGCAYCVAGCPAGIPIPMLFKIENDRALFGGEERSHGRYARTTDGKGKAGDCVSCGACEAICPQGLPVRALLSEISKRYDAGEKA